MLSLNAYAKINLCLDVVGRLENGYHQVRMIMQTVEIHDTLTFERTAGEIRITSDAGEIPLGEDNLIYKAASLMRERFQIDGGVSVQLEKRIPVAAGMAGGSTDAACTMKAMNLLYDLGLSEEELCALGVKIGADVPYCILGGTALSEGIGEVLTKLSPMPECVLLVAKPEIGVSTKEVYERIDRHEITSHPDVDGMQRAIAENDLDGVVKRLANVLATVTEEMHPVVQRIREVMLSQGALGSLMSGSGPSTFGIFEKEEKARAAGEQIRALGLAKQIFVTKPVSGRK